jgi:2,3-bisphosphoglycerate-independent phosphoglycerate mutase
MASPPVLVLIILDGFGCREEREWNAIAQADTPTFSRLFHEYPWTTLDASGLRVGLPEGQMGNSEVGHLNMGAGRVVDQDMVRISKAVESSEMSRNPILVETFERLRRTGNAMHFAGLLSDGGVHSLQSHLHGLIEAAVRNSMPVGNDGSPTVFVHAFLDGRDTPPVSAVQNLRRLLEFIADKPQVQLSTIIGRYYAMDRDRRWERTKRAYDLMTLGIGTETRNPIATLEHYYESNVTDEFMEPISVLDPRGAHRGEVADGDALLFFNFRADRMRQIVIAFRDPDFREFERVLYPRLQPLSMVRYREDFDLPVLFPPAEVRNHLGQVLASRKLRQLRLAETEKYAHVTFFFNGGSDRVSELEDRYLVPSPKVATYDLKPEMAVFEVAAKAVEEVRRGTYRVIVMNIANPDMVGHTGVMSAAVKAVEATDTALGQILKAVESVGGVALITADHGNCELMFDPQTGQPHTAHTTNPVPCILFNPRDRSRRLERGGALENIGPTVLEILGIPKPPEMTAKSLLSSQ